MTINKLLIATHNPGKLRECKERLSSLNIQLYSLSDLSIKSDFEEKGKSYQENAAGKAKYYYQLSQLPTLADDSGLSVDALGGEPGIHSRQWPGYTAGDEELLTMLLDKLEPVPDKDRTAQFVTVAALFDGDNLLIGRGECPGHITRYPQCQLESGLPYSSVFIPEGHTQVFSQLSTEDKNAISHRGRAIASIISQISNK